MKQMVKKMLCAAIAAVLLLSLAAGALGEAAKEPNPPSYSDIFDAETAPEKMKITLASIATTEGFDYNNGNEFFKYWSEKFGVEWEVISLSWDVWATQLNTWISAEDMPDWCIWNYNITTANEWVDQELLKKWPEDWRTKYPHLSAAADSCTYNKYFEDKYEGMYLFFKPLFFSNFPADFLTSSTTLIVRKDWAEQAGYDLSKNVESHTMTLNELFDYCRAIKQAGILEYPLDMSASNLITLMGYCTEGNGSITAAYTNYGADEYYWGPEQNAAEIKKYLGIIKQAYDEGLINPEFFASGDDGAFNTSGKSCATLYSCDPGSANGMMVKLKDNLDVDMEAQCESFVLTDENGVFHEEIRENYWTCNILSPNLSDEETERILAIWDYCCREDVQIALHMGFQGIDWDYNAEGLPESKLADTEYGDIYKKYTTLYPLYNMVALQGDDFMFIDANYPAYARELSAKMFQVRQNASSARAKVKDYDMSAFSSPHAVTSGIVYADEYAHLLTLSGDFDTNYDNFIKEYKAKAQLIVDDMNEYLHSLGR